MKFKVKPVRRCDKYQDYLHCQANLHRILGNMCRSGFYDCGIKVEGYIKLNQTRLIGISPLIPMDSVF